MRLPSSIVVATVVVVAAVGAGGGCNIFVTGACPDLAEACPDLQCDAYQQDRDGCSICACVGDEAPTVCWDDSECANGQRCDTVNFCERAPNCTADGPCPDACYGECIDANAACSSDADCKPNQICAFIDNGTDSNERPAPDDGSGDAPGGPVAAPTGVCLDVDCDNTQVAIPECPPGTEIGINDAVDPCNPTCIPIDACRQLLPEECLATPGCEIIDEPCGCDPSTGDPNGGACDCATIEHCVAVDDCSILGPDTCEANPNCVLVAVDGTAPGDGSGGAPAPDCDPTTDPNCSGVVQPPPSFVCVPRSSDGTCLSDADCLAGEACELTTVCGTGCEVNADGTETCFDQCWSERGVCLPATGTCDSLTPDQCSADPRCQLVDGTSPQVPCQCDPNSNTCACGGDGTGGGGGTDPAPPPQVCVPRSPGCAADADCLEGQHCEVSASCLPCDPSTGGDLNCAAPCFTEGTCVDGAPPPVECQADTDCGPGAQCVPVSVCETCPDQQPPPPPCDPTTDPNCSSDQPQPAPPPPCDPSCRDESVCVQTVPTCFDDTQCATDEFCDFSQLACGGAGALVARCPGLCEPLTPPTLCQSNDQCAAGQRCATEVDACLQNPNEPNSVGCWFQCVDDTTTNGGQFCLDDSQCADSSGASTGSCRFNANVCLDDPSSDVQVCSGWCAASCAAVVTSATDPATGQCATFDDSCTPPGWTVVNACP